MVNKSLLKQALRYIKTKSSYDPKKFRVFRDFDEIARETREREKEEPPRRVE
jgi:hypothetical protein